MKLFVDEDVAGDAVDLAALGALERDVFAPAHDPADLLAAAAAGRSPRAHSRLLLHLGTIAGPFSHFGKERHLQDS